MRRVTRTGRVLLALSLTTGVLVAAEGSARADFHLIKVTEVFAGTGGFAGAQYVELQMHAPGQTNLAGHSVTVQNATGGTTGTFNFTGAVTNGASQDTSWSVRRRWRACSA